MENQDVNVKPRDLIYFHWYHFIACIILVLFFTSFGYIIGVKNTSHTTKPSKNIPAEPNRAIEVIPKDSYPLGSFNYPSDVGNPSDIFYYTYNRISGMATFFKVGFQWGKNEPVKQKLFDIPFDKYLDPDGIWWSPGQRYILSGHIGDGFIYYLGSLTSSEITKLDLAKYGSFNAPITILGWIDNEHILYLVPPDLNTLNPPKNPKVKYWVAPVSNLDNRVLINNILGY